MGAKEEERGRWMCASRARDEYALSERDLAGITHRLVRNPHYRTAAPMRLYLIDDLAALAADKQAREEYRSNNPEHRKEAARERARDARERLQSLTAAAGSRLERADDPGGDSPLPHDLWVLVLGVIGAASVFEPVVYGASSCGLRTAVAAARDLARASCVCRDLRRAGVAAMADLGAALVAAPSGSAVRPRLPPPPPVPGSRTRPQGAHTADWPRWDALLVRGPGEHTVVQLREALRDLGAKGRTGVKAELVMRLLEHWGLGERGRLPRGMPAALWSEVLLERRAMRAGGALPSDKEIALESEKDTLRAAVVREAVAVARQGEPRRATDMLRAAFDSAAEYKAWRATLRPPPRICTRTLPPVLPAHSTLSPGQPPMCVACRRQAAAASCARRMCAPCCRRETRAATGGPACARHRRG